MWSLGFCPELHNWNSCMWAGRNLYSRLAIVRSGFRCRMPKAWLDRPRAASGVQDWTRAAKMCWQRGMPLPPAYKDEMHLAHSQELPCKTNFLGGAGFPGGHGFVPNGKGSTIFVVMRKRSPSGLLLCQLPSLLWCSPLLPLSTPLGCSPLRASSMPSVSDSSSGSNCCPIF